MICRNLYVVDLCPKLHALVFLAPDDGTEVRAVDADDAVLDLLACEQVRLLEAYLTHGAQPLFLFCRQADAGPYNCEAVPLERSLVRSFRSLLLSLRVAEPVCLRCLAYASVALATSLYLFLGTRSDNRLLWQRAGREAIGNTPKAV